MNPRELIESYVAEIAEHLPRKDRADIACELHALLNDDLHARAEAAGRPADEAMTRALLAEFGWPDEVATRYRPVGLTIIPPDRTRGFLQAAIIGVVLQWAVGIAVLARHVKIGTPVEVAIQEWFFSAGLGALWWPGFLVMCAAITAWLRQVRSRQSLHGQWHPATGDGFARLGAGLGLPLAALFAVFYVAPAWFVGHIAPAGFDVSGFTYVEEFRASRLPVLIAYMTANVVLLAFMAAQGQESRVTRRLAIAIGLVGVAVMSWCAFGGPMFMVEEVDKLVRLVLVMIVFFALLHLAKRIAREVILLR